MLDHLTAATPFLSLIGLLSNSQSEKRTQSENKYCTFIN